MKDNKECLIVDDLEVEITPDEYTNISNIQNEIFEMLAQHANSSKIFARLCNMAEALLPNSIASLMLMNDDTKLMSVLSAPSIPKVGIEALKDLKPGLQGGSCGNAVFSNKATYVQDTFSDDRWHDLRKIAYDFNICSCWSMPVRDENSNAIGTFALSSFEHRMPSLFHKKLLETGAFIVSIILKRDKQDKLIIKQHKRLELFGVAMAQATEGVMITDKNNIIIEINQAFTDILGYTKEDIIGQNPSLLSSGKQDIKFYLEMWKSISNNKSWTGELINRRKDGTLITQWLSVSSIKSDIDGIENFLAIFTDMSEIKKAQEKIEYMLYHDTLTGLPNQESLTLKIQNITQNISMVVLNIDNFSYINSGYGFKTANSLLQKVALLIKELNEDALVYRVHADEFAVIYENRDIVKDTILKIKNYFYNNSMIVDGITLKISFTYGGAYGDNNKVFRDSVLALKDAKRFGKNRYLISNEESKVSPEERKSFIDANNLIYKALEEDNFIPYFQGIHNNKTSKIEKYETLVRIKNDDKIISPIYFLETAKLSGLLPNITKIMIDKSFEIMSKRDCTFSLNITEDDLSMEYLVDYLTKNSIKYSVNPNRVVLEILEGVSSTSKNSNVSQLKSLKALGYHLAIDDFGTEYSNFERILDLDIDFLKIDGKYIKDINTNKKSYEITRAIVYFAKNANIPVIAEFVHNEEIQRIIKRLGIDYSQGYYFSQPDNIQV